jgi:hypothetical protein
MQDWYQAGYKKGREDKLNGEEPNSRQFFNPTSAHGYEDGYNEARQCGCQEIESPVPGVLWSPDTEEVQRCDTHETLVYVSDSAAADALVDLGWEVWRDEYKWFAHPPTPEQQASEAAAGPTITRPELKGLAQHAINSIARHQQLYLTYAERERLDRTCEEVSMIAVNRWWSPADNCGCLIGSIYGKDALSHASDAEIQFGLRFDELLGEHCGVDGYDGVVTVAY